MATVGFAVRCFLGGVIVGGVGAILGAFFLLTSPRSNKKDGKGNDEKEKSTGTKPRLVRGDNPITKESLELLNTTIAQLSRTMHLATRNDTDDGGLDNDEKDLYIDATRETLELAYTDFHDKSKDRTRQLKNLSQLCLEMGRAYHQFGKDLSKVSSVAKSHLIKKIGDGDPLDEWMRGFSHLMEALSADSETLGSVLSSESGVMHNVLLIADTLQARDKQLGAEGARVLLQLRESEVKLDKRMDQRDRYRDQLAFGGGGTLQKVIDIATHTKQQAEEEASARTVRFLQASELALLEQTTAHGGFETEFEQVMPRVLQGYKKATASAMYKTRVQLGTVITSIRKFGEKSDLITQRFQRSLVGAGALGHEAALMDTLVHLRNDSRATSPNSVVGSPSCAEDTAVPMKPTTNTTATISSTPTSSTIPSTTAVKMDVPKMNMHLEATSILAATAPAELPPLPPAFRSVVDKETCVWFNAFSGRVYRDAANSANFRSWLLEKLTFQLNKNSKSRPGFLDELKVVDVCFGQTPPLLLNVTWEPKVTESPVEKKKVASEKSDKTTVDDEDDDDEGEGGDADATNSAEKDKKMNEEVDEVACTADFAFRSGLKFTLQTKIWCNWPRDRYASIPVTLDLELVEISGRIKLGVRHSHSFVSFLEEPLTRFSIDSSLGNDSFKVSNIPQLSDFIIRKLDSFISRRLVSPNGHKFRLVWPRSWWPADCQNEFMSSSAGAPAASTASTGPGSKTGSVTNAAAKKSKKSGGKNENEAPNPADPTSTAATTGGKSTRLMSTAAASLSSSAEWLRSEVQKIRKPTAGDATATSEKTTSATTDAALSSGKGAKGTTGTADDLIADGVHAVPISRPPAAVEGIAAVASIPTTKNIIDDQQHQGRSVEGIGAGVGVAEMTPAHRAKSPPFIPSTTPATTGIASMLPSSVESLAARVRPTSPVEVATTAATSTSAGSTFSVSAALRSMASVPKSLLKSKIPPATTITDSASSSIHSTTSTIAVAAAKENTKDVQTSLDRITGHRFSSDTGLLKKTSAANKVTDKVKGSFA